MVSHWPHLAHLLLGACLALMLDGLAQESGALFTAPAIETYECYLFSARQNKNKPST